MATKDLLESQLTSPNLVNLTNKAVQTSEALNAAQRDISVRNLNYDTSLAASAAFAGEANQNVIKQTAAISNQIVKKEQELQEADSGSKAYRALYMVPVLNIIPAIIDSNIEGKREEINRQKETLDALNSATVTQDNNLSLQTKITELQKAVSTQNFIQAFEAKQNSNAELAGADQNFKFLQSRLNAETEKLRQSQIRQGMAIASRQEAREIQVNEARQRLLILQGDQAQAELTAFAKNVQQKENVIDSFNKSTGSALTTSTFDQLPDAQRTFIIQSQTGLLRTPEDMYAAWRAYGLTDNNINLIPTGMRDQIRSRTDYTNQVEREYYTSQAATDPNGMKTRDMLQLQFGELDPKTGTPTGRVDYNKIHANYQESKSIEIADSAGQSFIIAPGNTASREVVQAMAAQNKLPSNFTQLATEAVKTSLGLGNTEDKTLNALTDLVDKALSEQKAKSSELGIAGLSPLVASYDVPSLYGLSSTQVNVALTDANGNINRVKLKEMVRGVKTQINARSNISALSGNPSSAEILQNWQNSREQQNNTNINAARSANVQAISNDQNANETTLNNLNQ